MGRSRIPSDRVAGLGVGERAAGEDADIDDGGAVVGGDVDQTVEVLVDPVGAPGAARTRIEGVVVGLHDVEASARRDLEEPSGLTDPGKADRAGETGVDDRRHRIGDRTADRLGRQAPLRGTDGVVQGADVDTLTPEPPEAFLELAADVMTDVVELFGLDPEFSSRQTGSHRPQPTSVRGSLPSAPPRSSPRCRSS